MLHGESLWLYNTVASLALLPASLPPSMPADGPPTIPLACPQHPCLVKCHSISQATPMAYYPNGIALNQITDNHRYRQYHYVTVIVFTSRQEYMNITCTDDIRQVVAGYLCHLTSQSYIYNDTGKGLLVPSHQSILHL